MNKMRQLRDVVNYYTCDVSVNEIPDHYYDMMVDIWRSMNELDREWDKYNAASMLLCTVVRDGFIQQHQLTDAGDKALEWANEYVEDTDVVKLLVNFQRSDPK